MRVRFVVPAHGRIPLARILLPRLAEVCHELDASATVVADDENARIAHRVGFDVIPTDNRYLGRKFNDGLEHACQHADYVIPLGNDDLISPELVRELLSKTDGRRVICTARMSAVPPSGTEIVALRVPYPGGAGPRLIPAALLKACGGRPAEETKQRAIDTSIKHGLGDAIYQTFDTNPYDLVDLKTEGENLNTYEALLPYATARHPDAWAALAERHPRPVVDALEELYR